jgi:hypothetical protein
MGERLPLSRLLINGGGYSRVSEPLTVEKEYEALWKRAGARYERAGATSESRTDCNEASSSFRFKPN